MSVIKTSQVSETCEVFAQRMAAWGGDISLGNCNKPIWKFKRMRLSRKVIPVFKADARLGLPRQAFYFPLALTHQNSLEFTQPLMRMASPGWSRSL